MGLFQHLDAKKMTLILSSLTLIYLFLMIEFPVLGETRLAIILIILGLSTVVAIGKWMINSNTSSAMELVKEDFQDLFQHALKVDDDMEIENNLYPEEEEITK